MHSHSILYMTVYTIFGHSIRSLAPFNKLVVPFQTKSRDHDARDYYRARRQYRVISDDLLAKDVQIEDTKKRIKELEVKLADFATAYEVSTTIITSTVYHW